MKAPVTPHPDAATLGAYHDGEVRGVVLSELESHLAACAQCRSVLSSSGAVDAALRALPLVEPPDVRDAVVARARSGRRWRDAPRPRRPRRRIAAGVTGVLAALLGLIAGYDILMQAHSPSVALPSASTNHGAASFRQQGGFATVQRGAPTLRVVTPANRASGAAAGPANDTSGAAAGPAGPRPTHGAQSSAAPAGLDGRLVARTGVVDLRVPDVQRAFHAVSALAVHAGGYVSDSFDNAAGSASGAASLTLHVPAASFQATMDRLAALPHDKVTARSSSVDITGDYHDLQAQLQALQATRAQLLSLMRKAGSIRDAMSVLDRLTSVDTTIDSVQGQLMARTNSVMLSTITVNLAPQPRKGVVVAPRRPRAQWQPGRTLADALGHVGRALQAIVTAAIYLLVYLALPALLVVPVVLTRRLRRRPYP